MVILSPEAAEVPNNKPVQDNTPLRGGLSSPWQSISVGTVAVTGGASLGSGTFLVTGSGLDIWKTEEKVRNSDPAQPEGGVVSADPAAAAAPILGTATVITNIVQLCNLTNPGLRAECSVELDGNVIWANPGNGDLVLQDDSGVIFLKTDLKGQYQAGQQITLRGCCTPRQTPEPTDPPYSFKQGTNGNLGIAERSRQSRAFDASRTNMPMPRIVPGQKTTPEEQCQWSEVEGIVRFVTQDSQGALLELELDENRMTVQLAGADAANLVQYRGLGIRVGGFPRLSLNARGEMVAGKFWSPGLENLCLTKPPQKDWLALPRYNIRSIMATIPAEQPTKIVKQYALTSADDSPMRDPKDWQLLGSNDRGTTWTILDQRRNEVFGKRRERRVFDIINENAYNVYRLQINATALVHPKGVKPNYWDLTVQLAKIEFLGPPENERSFEGRTEKIPAARGEFPPAETKEMALDDDEMTKWLDHATNSWIQVQYDWTRVPTNRVFKVRGRMKQHLLGNSFILEGDQTWLRVRSPQQIPAGKISEPINERYPVELAAFLDRTGDRPELYGAYIQYGRESAPKFAREKERALVLTNATQINRLSIEEQLQNIPVRLRGVVTCYLSVKGGADLKTVQDATGGVALRHDWSGPGRQGDLVEVNGYVEPSGSTRTPRIVPTTVVLGSGEMPKPAHPSWESLQTGEQINQWVELFGVVRSAENDGFILQVKGGQLPVRMTPANTNQIKDLADAAVTVRGVCRVEYVILNTFQMKSFMLETPGMEFVQVDKPALRDPFSLTAKPITNLLHTDSLVELSHREKIAGVVTYANAQSGYVQDDSGVVQAVLAKPGGWEAGDQVELVGFPERGDRLPMLVGSLVRKQGTTTIPPAIRLSMDEILSGDREGRRVRLEAVCLGRSTRGQHQILELLAENRTFWALLSSNRTEFPAIPTGSRLELTGVCRAEAGIIRRPGQPLSSFELLLNGPSDVVILSRPSWWTWKHTLAVVGVMAIGLGTALSWIRTLRRQVNERTASLMKKTTELAEEINERKIIQAKLEEQKTSLETEIAERIRMEREIEAVHRQLVDASRKAGMAEIATGVLHNVGNVLNSVNVSVNILLRKIQNSPVSGLQKLVELLQDHATDFENFILSDPKGKKIPAYLTSLASVLAREQSGNKEEIETLIGHVEHIERIVAMQQTHAKNSVLLEKASLTSAIEDALKIQDAEFASHDVKIIKQFAEIPEFYLDRHKTLQVLVNLLSNAKYACDEGRTTDKTITLRTGVSPNGKAFVEVRDNGVGIPTENLDRIFNHGFTTRKEGHGFGLHSSANAATEMGGSLAAHSEGPGLGAIFLLEIPLKMDGLALNPALNGPPLVNSQSPPCSGADQDASPRQPDKHQN